MLDPILRPSFEEILRELTKIPSDYPNNEHADLSKEPGYEMLEVIEKTE